ncbi:SDR family NAD(P)-dependent oxidoreductase [Deinococcus yavapaiensis]|uniref:SDR family NAD(P)-dependent oxidoreductase n=1 Tax=Deinococcus yavapaiensis TaxID=309889 RepID=UPI000DA25557|nr:SDR family NAD(P)-dependent oxidoreductase [Deinococcus yavapaiensis]
MTTLILGATGGLGSALARVWPDRPLVVSGRDEAKLSELAFELGARPCKADVGYESHVQKLFASIESVGADLDTIVYAAGSVAPEPLSGASADVTRRVWNANYFGALWTLKHGLPKLKSGGRAYFVGARPELVTARGFAQYAASKAALARALDIARLEHRGVTITLVLPPAVDTPLWSAVGRVPRGALRASEVAEAILRDRLEDAGQTELRPE